MNEAAASDSKKLTLAQRIIREARSIVPAIVYFFVAFSLFNLTLGRMMSAAGIHANSFARTLVMSLIIGKVVLIANHMPFFNLFPGKPLIYNTLWKTSIYTLFNFLVRAIENIVRLAPKYDGAGGAWNHVTSTLTPLKVFTVHLWFFILFLIFVMATDLSEMIGREKLRKIYFGR